VAPRLQLDQAVPVLVLKVGRYRLHHGGVAVIRTLGRAGVPVYGVHEDRLAPAALSAHLTAGFVWPTGRASTEPDEMVSALGRIADRIGRPSIVVATDDKAALALDACAPRLRDRFILPAWRAGLAGELVDKRTCAELAARAGIHVPASVLVRAPTTTDPIVTLPLAAKRTQQAIDNDGQRGFSTVIVRTQAELRALLRGPDSEPFEVLLQPLIPGDDWLYHGYYDAGSSAVVSFTGRKLRSRPPEAGETASACSQDNAELRSAMERFLGQIGYVGPVSIDVRRDDRTGDYVLLDVNPRVGACFRLFVNHDGIDVVRAMHLDLTSREVPRRPQRDRRTYVVENYNHGGDIRRWWTEIRRARERAWLHPDDLVPAIATAIQLVLGEPRTRKLAGGSTQPRYFRGRAHRRIGRSGTHIRGRTWMSRN
jgi:predicted ATP-grasp superfamily ATP-dependent carboligase